MTKILLVDDEERLLRSLAFFFEDEGFDVLTAKTGEEALTILRQEQLDVCVVDMRLPGIDGNEVIRQSCKDGLLSKFLIHTGSSDYLLPDDILNMGITHEHVFSKPLADLSILVNAVQVLVKDQP